MFQEKQPQQQPLQQQQQKFSSFIKINRVIINCNKNWIIICIFQNVVSSSFSCSIEKRLWDYKWNFILFFGISEIQMKSINLSISSKGIYYQWN